MKYAEKIKSKFSIGFFTIFLLAVMLCYAVARHMPYLLNMHNMWAYFSFSFTTISLSFIYIAFFNKSKKSGLTRYEESYSDQSLTNSFHKLEISLAVFFLLASMIWMSWGVVALSAYLYSKEPYYGLYAIDALQYRGRRGSDIVLVDINNKNEYSLALSTQYVKTHLPWVKGEVVCVKGRTSFFGSIIEDLVVGECKLEGFRLD